MDKASETLFALKPVTFRYKKEVNSERALSFGLIAEDVAEISPALITRDEKGNLRACVTRRLTQCCSTSF